jgi:DNA polymerase I-like protein with 3'-5' exonuclease and polymerase domains
MKLQNYYRLPKTWTPIEIAEYLLKQFERTYPTITQFLRRLGRCRNLHYRMLTGPTGWTRYCFDNPKTSKPARNAYVAHCAQSLNAMVLNKAWLKVFYDIAINPEHANNFKLIAQIHDSILFQYREGHEYLAEMVKERMQIPITVKGADGKTRTFVVPAAVKIGTPENGFKAKYWSETE